MPTSILYHLRRWQPGDELALAKYANNYRIWRNVRDSFPHPYTLDDAHHWIELCEMEKRPSVFAIDVEGEAVGGVGIILQKDVFRKNAEIGYWLAEPFWGRGIMAEAVKEMTEYTFKHYEVHRLYAGVFEYNRASMRVLEKAGYQFEAVLRQSVCKEDKIWDEHVYVKFRVETKNPDKT
ncbi:GNAT family N-acetyltransferase [Runella aurantiaca]|uniref:GNAT family N-acetyltransferase n=1 Tax=Runella aurantiaca TaxID=2282308 RepID=UPI001E2B4950|nr:GNAT family N-acetyltransferase [Runella aurantiaca]